MALSLKGKCLLSRLKALMAVQRFKHTDAESGRDLELERRKFDTLKGTKLDSRTLGITKSMISPSSYSVLQILKNAGFEAYLVGGCVRDLILNKVPKDFDVITTAELKQIKKQFHCARIIGQRFPICLVHFKGSDIEVSSFQTGKAKGNKKLFPQMPQGFDKKDILLWSDSMRRDFTVNSLFFEPFANKIYDYSGAVMDLKSLKLQTLIPAQISFEEDPARILRGMRIAARLGLSISKEIETAIHKLSSSIARLPESRLMMEMNYMLSYGAAEASICLLRRFHLLQTLLPLHDAHLAQQINRGSDMNSLFFMRLLSSLDKLVTCDRPSDCILWVAILSFHLALLNKPQIPHVIWTFGHLLYYDNWPEGVQFARKIAEVPVISVAEFSESCNDIDMSTDALIVKITQLARAVKSSVHDLTGTNSSDWAYIPKNTGKRTDELFSVLAVNATTLKSTRKRFNIDYGLLGKGDISETRCALGRIILDTMSSFVCQSDGIDKKTAKFPNQDTSICPFPFDLKLIDLVEEQNSKKNQKLIKLEHASGSKDKVQHNEKNKQVHGKNHYPIKLGKVSGSNTGVVLCTEKIDLVRGIGSVKKQNQQSIQLKNTSGSKVGVVLPKDKNKHTIGIQSAKKKKNQPPIKLNNTRRAKVGVVLPNAKNTGSIQSVKKKNEEPLKLDKEGGSKSGIVLHNEKNNQIEGIQSIKKKNQKPIKLEQTLGSKDDTQRVKKNQQPVKLEHVNVSKVGKTDPIVHGKKGMDQMKPNETKQNETNEK